MKNIFFLIAFSALSLCGYSQTFNYEMNSWAKTAPAIDNGNQTSSQQIAIVVTIAGDIYGFTQPVGKPNTTTVIYPNKFKDQDQINSYINEQAVQWVKDTYPSK